MTGTTRPFDKPRSLESIRIIWALFTKDALEALKNKNTIAIIISSLFMVFFYSFLPALYGLEDRPALLLYDGGSSSLVPLLEDSRNIRLYTYQSEEQMKRVLTHGEAPELGLVIPAGFDQALQAGESPRLQGYVLRWVSDADAEALRSIVESEISTLTGQTVPVELDSNRIELLPESSGLGETASFGVAYVLIMIGVILVPHLMLEEKQNRTLEVLSLSPASAGHIVAGKALAGIFYCSLGGIIALAVNHVLIVHWWLAILTVLVGSLFTVSLGLWLGIKIDSRAQLAMWSWVILLPLIMPIIFSLLEGLIPTVWVRIFSLVPSSVILQLSKTSFANPIPIGLTLLRLAWVAVVAGAGLGCVAWLLHLRDREGGALSSPWQPSSASGSNADRPSPLAPLLQKRLAQRSTAELSAGGSTSRGEGSTFDEPRPRGNLSLIGVIAAKDLLEALKNKLILSILLGSTFILLSGALLPMLITAKNLPRLVVYDEGRSTILRDLAAREDIRVRMVESQKEMELSLVGSTDLSLGLILPADFDLRAGDGQSIELQSYYPHWAGSDQLSQLEIFFEEQFYLAAPEIGQLILADQAVYPPLELSGQPAMLLMNLVAVILVIGIALVPLLMIEEKEAQTLKVLLVSPANLTQVVAGKALVGLFYSLLPVSLVMLLYRYLFVHWGVAVLAIFLISALAVSIGLLLGVLVDSPTSASMWGSLVLLLVIGSGMLKLFDLDLPPAVLSALEWLPGSASLQLFSISQAGDFPASMLWLNLSAMLAAIAVVMILLAWRVRRMEA